jgi:hypothetical protein
MGIRIRLQAVASCDNSWMRTYNDGSRKRCDCSSSEVHTEEFESWEWDEKRDPIGFRDRAMEHFCEEGYRFVEVKAPDTLVGIGETEIKCLCPHCEGLGIDPDPNG